MATIFPRIREIADPYGEVVRISVEPHPRGALVLIDRNRIAEKLPDTLDHLIHHPELIRGKEDRIRQYTEKHLKPWDERMAHEIDALCRLAEG